MEKLYVGDTTGTKRVQLAVLWQESGVESELQRFSATINQYKLALESKGRLYSACVHSIML